MSNVPPDWYPDPTDAVFLRYWNGTDWTADRKPLAVPDSVDPSQPPAAQPSKVPLFGARAHARRQSQELADLLADNQRLRAQLASVGGLEVVELQRLRDQLAAQIVSEHAQLDDLREQLIATRDEQVLQEIGIYEYRHPLSDAVAYRAALKQLQGEIKDMARRGGGAIEAPKAWVVEGSVTSGRKMSHEYSTLMLRSYNAEASYLVRTLRPHRLTNALDHLDKVAVALTRLGETMQIRVSPAFHDLRRRELMMTAEYLEILADQKEDERAQREKLREDRRAREELARERARLEKEEQRSRDELAALESTGNADTPAAGDARQRLENLHQALIALADREGNIRAGHIYVISNIGVFGPDVVMIGMTRRVDPADRIRELNNTSVPFKYDVHTTFFDDDAVGIEAELHRLLADKRVNKVNNRREFFRVTLAEVRDHLQTMTGNLVHFDEIAEAAEYRQSLAWDRDHGLE